MNNCTIYGRLGKDSVSTKTAAGLNVLKFSVANNTGYNENKKTNWFNCVLFGKRGESLEEYLLKGTAVVVSGEVTLNTYTNKDGAEISSLSLNVKEVTLAGSKSDNASGGSDYKKPEAKAKAPAVSEGAISFDDDDIPF